MAWSSHLEPGLVAHEELLESLLQVGFRQHARDDVCNLAFVHHVHFGYGLHAERLDEPHVLALVAAHYAEGEVHAGRKLAHQLGVGPAVGVFSGGKKHRDGAGLGGLDDLGLKIFSGNLYNFCHAPKFSLIVSGGLRVPFPVGEFWLFGFFWGIRATQNR